MARSVPMPLAICLAACLVGRAAAVAQESRLAADFRGEGERFTQDCTSFSFSAIASCGELLFTDHPLHIAIGSLAPGNGVGLGLSLVGHWTTENWRNNWDFDAVGTPNGSWRAGGYLTLVYVRRPTITISTGAPSGGKPAPKSNLAVEEQPVVHVYAETTSLNSVKFFGLGPSTSATPIANFGERETITGANIVWPLWKRFNLSLFGEANGRFVDITNFQLNGAIIAGGSSLSSTVPPPANVIDIAGAGFAQFGQGVRIRPTFANDYVRLNYSVNFQEFVGSSHNSFQRFTTDLQHQIALYRNTRTLLPRDFNGPDSCTADVADSTNKCPPLIAPAPPGKTRNLEGSVGLRLLIQESIVPNGLLPFYFQPTLGGTDINGFTALGSFQDYRFRAPNLMLFRANIEHSIYKWPIGVIAMIDEGKVALTRSDIDFSHLRHSYSAGLTLRAGGFPLVYLLFSWGGGEGTRTSGRIDTSLLGGSPHPSLF